MPDTPTINGGTIPMRLDRIEAKLETTQERATEAVQEVDELKSAVLGSALIPEDRGALGRLESKLDRYIAAARDAQISRRGIILSGLGIGVGFAAVLATILIHH